MPTTYPQAAIDKMLAAIQFDAQGLVPGDRPAARHRRGADDGLDGSRRRRRDHEHRPRLLLVALAQGAVAQGRHVGPHPELVELRVDCDGDTLLVEVEQTGVACHTGRHNCFFRAIRDGELTEIAPIEVDMASIGKD